MPNLRNAKKALRQNKTHAERNKVALAEIHSLRVKLRKAVTSKKVDDAVEIARLVGQKLDKAVQKNLLKRGTVSRYKSRLMKKVNALKNA